MFIKIGDLGLQFFNSLGHLKTCFHEGRLVKFRYKSIFQAISSQRVIFVIRHGPKLTTLEDTCTKLYQDVLSEGIDYVKSHLLY